jgi:uncharacterized membrane protein (Fun14 family)
LLGAAGVVPINWFALTAELQRDWRQDGETLLQVLTGHLPSYSCLVHSSNNK